MERIKTFEDRALERRKQNKPNPLEYVGAELFVHLLLPRVRRINSNITVNYPEDFEDEITSSIKNQDLLVIVSNHDSYHNAQSQAAVSNDIFVKANEISSESFPGFRMPVSAALTTGDQGYLARRIYEESEPMLNEKHLFTFPHTRAVDIAKYATPANSSEYFRTLDDTICENYGIGIFPEGNMGNGAGMREFKDGTLT